MAQPSAIESATLELRSVSLRNAGSSFALSLRSDARRVGLVGDWEPFFQALTGQAPLASGSALILGQGLETALAAGLVGFAACDPPLPASFTVTQYLQHAARLSHGSPTRALHDARRALEQFELTELASQKLSHLVMHQRRALGIALATLTSPPVVCLEAPLRGLDAPSADYITRLCVEAGRYSRVIVSAERPSTPSAERTLLDSCDELFWLERAELLAQGAPASVFKANGRYSVIVKGHKIPEFSQALSDAGCKLNERTQPGSYLLELPENGTTDLVLDMALAQGVVVLELEPLFATP